MFFNRYVLGFIVAFGLIIIILALIFTGSGKNQPTPKPLTDYAYSDSSVEMNVYGPIVADQNHNQVNVYVNQNSAGLVAYQGFNFHQIGSKSYNNNFNSYQAFLAALNFAGYNSGTTNPSLKSSLGYCATGSVYTFKLFNDGQTVSSYWVSTCTGDPKTFLGNYDRVTSLFEAQIPDYDTLISNLNIQ